MPSKKVPNAKKERKLYLHGIEIISFWSIIIIILFDIELIILTPISNNYKYKQFLKKINNLLSILITLTIKPISNIVM